MIILLVLGAISIGTSDLDSYAARPEKVITYSWHSESPQHAPQAYAMVLHIRHADYCSQICVDISGWHVYYRTFEINSWTVWHTVARDFPDFYKNYADLASLATALGVVNNNPAKTFGIYQGWSTGGYIRICAIANSYPRFVSLLFGTFGAVYININGSGINTIDFSGSKILAGNGIVGFELWYHENNGKIYLYAYIIGDIYKLEMYNINTDGVSPNMAESDLPSGASSVTIS